MTRWWIRYEEEYGENERWVGPFDDQTRAGHEAKRLSESYDAMEKFAETIQGTAGGKGERFLEYYRGEEFPSGGSSWYGGNPPQEIDIPGDAGGR